LSPKERKWLESGRLAERDYIVKWLRDWARKTSKQIAWVIVAIANRIQLGEHQGDNEV
jgi:hypothetical protein